ncbi:hypothetical protein AMQ83_12420 [Paenibacillus riograndensis]|nr:hypothetical protein AMQ83_12420 [Paenibacillus riograndensis]
MTKPFFVEDTRPADRAYVFTLLQIISVIGGLFAPGHTNWTRAFLYGWLQLHLQSPICCCIFTADELTGIAVFHSRSTPEFENTHNYRLTAKQ